MEFIANFWWVWLCLFLGSIGGAIVVNFLSVKDTMRTITTGVSGVLKSDNERIASTVGDIFENIQSSFFSRIWKFVLITLLGWASGVLLLLSIIVNIAKLFTLRLQSAGACPRDGGRSALSVAEAESKGYRSV